MVQLSNWGDGRVGWLIVVLQHFTTFHNIKLGGRSRPMCCNAVMFCAPKSVQRECEVIAFQLQLICQIDKDCGHLPGKNMQT